MNVQKTLHVMLLIAATTFVPATADAQQYHLLIITPPDFVDELQPLVNWKYETNRPTALVTLGQVYEKDYGKVRDEPEQIKRFIEEFVTLHQVPYVMLVGDCDRFPVRYIKAYNTEWGDKYYPSDLYYMDLYNAYGKFDDWDGDGDNIIGEMNFSGGTILANVNLDNINMYPDVSVARVPASNDMEVARYVDKVLRYESAIHPLWFNKTVLIVDGGTKPPPFGSTEKSDALAPNLSGFPVARFYQDNAPYKAMTPNQRAAEINKAINEGVGFVSYHGHGNRTLWSGWYDDSQIAALTNNNERLPIVFATSCYTGRFHFDRNNYITRTGAHWTGGGTQYPEPMSVQPTYIDTYGNESMAEHFLVKNSTGAVAYMGCASVCEHGAWLDNSRGFVPDFFEEYAAGQRVLGAMWTLTLEKFIDALKDPKTGGMHYYSFIHIHKINMFGDPSLALPIMPLPDIKANGQDGPVTMGTSDTLEVTIELDPANRVGDPADYWVLLPTPVGVFSNVLGYWLPGIWPHFQGPVHDFGTKQVLKLSGISPGQFTFFFAVDTNLNGLIDLNDLYWDYVQVKVQ